MFSGTTTAANCASRQRRGSPSDGARADASHNLSHITGLFMASMLTVGMTNAAPVPRAGQIAPKR
jgi:hypothetical protein